MDEVLRVDPAGGAPSRVATGLEEWVRTVATELGVDRAAADVPALLDLARDAADGIGRPAAPLTTFLVGYAAGLAGGDRATLDRLTAEVGELARQWAQRPDNIERPGHSGQHGAAGR